MLIPIIPIRIPHRRLHRLRRLTRPTLHPLRRRPRRLPHPLGHRHILLIRLVRPLIRINLILPIFLDEGREVFDGAGAGVGDWGVFAPGGEELDGGEALDFVGDVVGRGVDFGDYYGGGGGVERG